MKHIAIMVIFLIGSALAQDVHVPPRAKAKAPAAAPAPAGLIEVTRTDIATVTALRSDSLTTFGVRLGDSEEQMRQRVTMAGLKLQARTKGECCDLLDQHSNAVAIFHLREGRIAGVAWGSGLRQYMPGRGGEIFNPEIADSDSPLRLELLGREDRREIERGLYPTVTYFYDREGIRIFRMSIGDLQIVNVELVPPAKPR